jgi:hypothetical protein
MPIPSVSNVGGITTELLMWQVSAEAVEPLEPCESGTMSG